VFKFLAGEKSYINFVDFVNLTEERRRKLDPGQMALTVKQGHSFRTPSR